MSRDLRRVSGLAAFVFCAAMMGDSAAAGQSPTSPRLAAIFAHPDDEIAVGPLLARYARAGADVRLVLATRGDRGTRITKIPAGEALGRAREEEAVCSAERLGISRPLFLNFGDGTLALTPNLRQLGIEVARVLKDLRPNAVVTWGPEGLDGHPDHRIIGAVVTQVLQGWPDGDAPALFYPGFPVERAAAVPDSPFARTPTLDRFLTVRVPFETRDLESTGAAFACHVTQYTQEERDAARPRMERLLGGIVYLRPAFAEQAPRADIFAAP